MRPAEGGERALGGQAVDEGVMRKGKDPFAALREREVSVAG